MSRVYWSRLTDGHWTLLDNGRVVARAIRRGGQWAWGLEDGPSGTARTLDFAMQAVGKARRKAA